MKIRIISNEIFLVESGSLNFLVLKIALRDANLLSSLQRPVNLTTDRSNTFRHIHNPKLRRRDFKKYGNQKQVSFNFIIF